MNLADSISRDTARFDPGIERHEGGSITFHWPRPLALSAIADATGLDEEMFYRTRKAMCLDLPSEIAVLELAEKSA